MELSPKRRGAPVGNQNSKGNRGRTNLPRPIDAGAKRKYDPIRLSAADGILLRRLADGLGLAFDDFLRRLAASEAADPAGTRAAVAPLVEVEAWDGVSPI